MRLIVDPLLTEYSRLAPIQSVLQHLASQENCDGEPYDQMVSAADYIDELEEALEDWLDCADTPEEWMRCRNNAKRVLGRESMEVLS
jgi:hypothetical protein